jgi:hypothetical protein
LAARIAAIIPQPLVESKLQDCYFPAEQYQRGPRVGYRTTREDFARLRLGSGAGASLPWFKALMTPIRANIVGPPDVVTPRGNGIGSSKGREQGTIDPPLLRYSKSSRRSVTNT